jgi:hypothetical protein
MTPTSEFIAEALQLTAPLTARYGLQPVPAADDVFLLVGRDFAVQLTADFDTTHVAYVDAGPAGRARVVGLDAYLQDHRFTPEDRARFGQPVGRVAHVLAALRVLVSGLLNRCDDILRGDRAWLTRLRGRDPSRWAGGPPDPTVDAVLGGIWTSPPGP